MAEAILDIPKRYKDGEPLFEAYLDDIRNSINEWAGFTVNNLKQLRLDIFSAGYTLDNNGVANRSVPIQDAMATLSENETVTGNWTYTGTTLFSGQVTLDGTIRIGDTSKDHDYVFGVSELTADRTITLPLLAADDTFVFESHAQALSNKTLTLPLQISDTSDDHYYVFAVSELIADRTVTLPLLTSNDTFVFEDHAQTLTNKTLTSPAITTPDITAPIQIDRANVTTESFIIYSTASTNKWYVGLNNDSTDHLWVKNSSGNRVLRFNDSATAAVLNINEGNDLDTARLTLDRSTTSDESEIQWLTGGTSQWELGLNISGSNDLALTENGTTRWRIEDGTGDLLLRATDPPTANYMNRESGLKARGFVTSTGTLNGSYNISSVSKPGTGQYTVNWDTNFSNTNYSVTSNCTNTTSSSIRNCSAENKAVGSAAFRIRDLTNTYQDNNFDFIAAGNQ